MAKNIHNGNTPIQQITISYIESRLCMADMLEEVADFTDPLEDEVVTTEQLEVLSNLGRCKYQDTANHILKHFEEILKAQEVLS